MATHQEITVSTSWPNAEVVAEADAPFMYGNHDSERRQITETKWIKPVWKHRENEVIKQTHRTEVSNQKYKKGE